MKELTAKKYLESKGLNDHDYMDGGMINHISEMMEEYHQAKLHLLTIPVVVGQSEQLIAFMKYVQTKQGIHFIDKNELANEYLKSN